MSFKRSLYLKLKLLQVKIATWRRKNEIAKAYGKNENRNSGIVEVLSVLLRKAHYLIAGAAVIVLLMLIPYRSLSEYVTGLSKSIIEGMNISEENREERGPDTPGDPDSLEDKDVRFICEAETLILNNDSVDCSKPPRKFRHMILVNKTEDTLYLIEYTENLGPRVQESYHVAVGKNLGPKDRNGDLKTPEGLYNIIGRREEEELPHKYGPYSFILNYPNHTDVMDGRTGYGIWIHGTAPDSSPLYTKGCVEMRNRDLRQLAEVIGLGVGVPVLITSVDTLQDPEGYPDYTYATKKRCDVMRRYYAFLQDAVAFLKKWSLEWESRDINRYSACYDSTQFSGYGLDWSEWRVRKERTFRNYDWIKISGDKIILTEMNKRFITLKFIQNYTSNLFDSKNGKMIRLSFDGREFKIIKEESISEKEILKCYSQRKRTK
ncbi:MAG: L,D-transpeptidase family protein [Chitinivibrionales bacterium]